MRSARLKGMLLGTVMVANITFWGLVEDGFNIMNQVFCTFNGIRIWFPFFVYFLCRKFGAMNVHTGILYLDIPQEGRVTFYEKTGNWFPWVCVLFSVFAVCSGFVFRKKSTIL